MNLHVRGSQVLLLLICQARGKLVAVPLGSPLVFLKGVAGVRARGAHRDTHTQLVSVLVGLSRTLFGVVKRR